MYIRVSAGDSLELYKEELLSNAEQALYHILRIWSIENHIL